MYQVILFDLDDTLLDFRGAEQLSLAQVQYEFYAKVELREFVDRFHAINRELWRHLEANPKNLMPGEVGLERFARLSRTLNYYNYDAALIAKRYETLLVEHTNWLSGAMDTIEALAKAGYILGIITNGITHVQQGKYARHNLGNWFNCFVVSDEIGVSKPDPAIFKHGLNLLRECFPGQLDSEGKVLMVGDSLTSDGIGAQNIGADFCWINPAIHQHNDTCKISYQLQSVSELPAVLS